MLLKTILRFLTQVFSVFSAHLQLLSPFFSPSTFFTTDLALVSFSFSFSRPSSFSSIFFSSFFLLSAQPSLAFPILSSCPQSVSPPLSSSAFLSYNLPPYFSRVLHICPPVSFAPGNVRPLI